MLTLFISVDQYRINIVSNCVPQTLFTLFTSSTKQCCTISNQNHVDIAYLLLPSLTLWTPQYCTISIEHFVNILYLKQHLHRSHRWHCNVVWYRINIVSTFLTSKYLVYIVYIVDIAMLYDVERHRVDVAHIIDIAILYDVELISCGQSLHLA